MHIFFLISRNVWEFGTIKSDVILVMWVCDASEMKQNKTNYYEEVGGEVWEVESDWESQ